MRVPPLYPHTHFAERKSRGPSKKGTTILGEPSRKERLGLEPLGLGTTVVPVLERVGHSKLLLSPDSSHQPTPFHGDPRLSKHGLS